MTADWQLRRKKLTMTISGEIIFNYKTIRNYLNGQFLAQFLNPLGQLGSLKGIGISVISGNFFFWGVQLGIFEVSLDLSFTLLSSFHFSRTIGKIGTPERELNIINSTVCILIKRATDARKS